MLNEGRGISEINKIETENIFNIFLKNHYTTFDHQILNKIIEVSFKEGNYDSKFYKKNNKYYILITCPEEYNSIKVKSILTHELNHFIEVSKIEDKKYRYPNYNKIKKSLIEFKPNNKLLDFFKHLIYKTLDNEINANIAQTYTYLREFNISDEQILKTKLEEYDIRKEYKTLLNFNINRFKKDINDNNVDFTEFNNILIKHQVDLDFINTNNIDKYINGWFKIINSNIKKLLKKQDNIIKEVIEDMNNYTTYTTNENVVLNFNEYLKYNLNS